MPPAASVQDQDVSSERYDEDSGQATADHGLELSEHAPVTQLQVAVQRGARDARAIGEARQQSLLDLRAGGAGDDCPGNHGGHVWAGRDRVAQLLDHYRELSQPVAGASVLLGQVQAEPSDLAQIIPERGQRIALGLERQPG